MFGDNPLGWETLGTKETIRAARRARRSPTTSTTGTRPTAWSSASSGMVGERPPSRCSRSCSATCARTATTRSAPVEHVPRRRAARAHPPARTPTRRTSASASRATRIDHPDRYALQLLATVLGGGMSSRLFLEVRERRGLAYYVYGTNHSYTDAGSLVLAGGRRHQPHRRGDQGRSPSSSSSMADEPVPADELEKARAFAKGRFVLQTESPQGLIMFGLRREVLEGEAIEPDGAARGARRGHRRGRPARRAGPDRARTCSTSR